MKKILMLTCFLFYVQLASSGESMTSQVEPFMIGAEGKRPIDRQYALKIMLLTGLKSHKICGGARIGPSWLITAAECIVDADEFDAVYIYYPRQSRTFGNVYATSALQYTLHPKFNRKTKENNIVLINCCDFQNVDRFRLPILPKEQDYQPVLGETLDISSWARSAAKDEEIIQSMNATVINSIWCTILYPFSPVRNNHICLSGWKSKGLEEIDVGAPLVVMESELKLIGLATTVRTWAHRISFPMEFTSIYPYRQWIHEVTQIPI